MHSNADWNHQNSLQKATLLVLGFSLLPLALQLLSLDFSSATLVPSLPEPRSKADLFVLLSGALAHTLLEWSAFTVAVMTAVLGLVHYCLTKDTTLPVICMALFGSGLMDAMRILAADRLIYAVADNDTFIPLTWVVSRSLHALIFLAGISLLLINPKLNNNNGLHFMLWVSGILVTVGGIIISYCANSHHLPVMLFPETFLHRPWDLVPLLLYVLCAYLLLTVYRRKFPYIFSHALLLSMIPEIAAQLHLAFGSSAIFDNNFYIAHFLKIFAYLIPAVGLLIGYIQTYKDLQHSKNLLFQEQAKAHAILDNAMVGIVSINSQGLIQSFNRKAEMIFGYSEKEVFNKNINMIMPSPYHEEHDSYLRNYKASGNRKIIGLGREVCGKRKNGEEFPLDLGVAEVKLQHETIFTGFLSDISERKSLENKLQSGEHLFSTFINSAPMMMWMLDANNKPIMFNETWLNLTGNSLEQELAEPWDGKNIHPEDRQTMLAIYHQALLEHQSFDQEYRILGKEGEFRWIREIGVPHRVNNSYQGFIGIGVDITNKKRNEIKLNNYNQDLKRSNAELEQFAYVASHDLQEPLRMVSSYTQLLARRYKDQLDDDANEFIAFAVDGSNRMQKLIQDLLSYSRVGKSKLNLVPVELDSLISTVLTGLTIAIQESHADIEVQQHLPRVLADQSQIQQLLQNLISNAIKYRSVDRTPHISIHYKKHNTLWQFSIADNGIGISDEYYSRIFIIFQRLHGKDQYSGTGIGLAVCKRIVEGHGGTIWLESEPGKGSTFHFTLPDIGH